MRKVLLMGAAIAAFAVAQAGQANAGFLFFGNSGSSSCCQPAPAQCCQPAPAQCCQAEDRCPLTGLPKLKLPKLSLPKLSLPKLNLFGSSNCCQPACAPVPTCSGGAGHAPSAPAVEELSSPPTDSAAKPYEEKAPAPAPPTEVPAATPSKDPAPAPAAPAPPQA